MADADYYEEGATPKKEPAQSQPAPTPSNNHGFVKGQLHKHMFKGSQNKGDLMLLSFAYFLFWVGMWSVLVAILFWGVDRWLGIGFSWLIVLLTGLMLGMMWITRCQKCKGRCN
jgi:hypothetical protein